MITAKHGLAAILFNLWWEVARECSPRDAAFAAAEYVACLDAVLCVPTLACAFRLEDLSRHVVEGMCDVCDKGKSTNAEMSLHACMCACIHANQSSHYKYHRCMFWCTPI